MKKFTKEYAAIAGTELNTRVSAVVAEHFDFTELKADLQNSLENTRSQLFPLKGAFRHLNIDHIKDIEVSDEQFSKNMSLLKKEDRAAVYKYRDCVMRITMLNTVINSKQKLHKTAKELIEVVIKAALTNGAEEITLSQAVHQCKLKPTVVYDKTGKATVETDQWMIDEIRLQFINELAELDYLELKVKDKTHMVALGDTISEGIDKEEVRELGKIAQFLAKKTIWLDQPPVTDKGMVTTSSWYYQTPTLSADQIEYFEAMHNTKYQFVDNAEELIEQAYLEHLQEEQLPIWAGPRIEFFKEQIRASHANGGHYIAVKGDSIWRAYMMAEIGHFQTSPALRALVKVADIKDKTKYDAKNNVVQVYALGLRSRSLGSYVQIVEETSWKQDIRKTMAEVMNRELEVTVFNKDNIKPLFMIWAYNAGKKRLMEGVTSEELSIFGTTYVKETTPGLISLAGIEDHDLIWTTWEDTLKELVPEIVVLKQVFKRLIKHNPLNEVQWTMPDGAIAQYASAETVSKELHWVSSNGRKHQHTHYRKEIVTDAKSAGLLPRVIHSIDAYIARQLVLRASRLNITVVPNHDSFTFDEQFVDVIVDLIKRLYVEVMELGVLEDIVQQLNVANKSISIKDKDGMDIVFTQDLTAEAVMSGMPVEYEA